jgi:SAM-dependent methyltransferase
MHRVWRLLIILAPVLSLQNILVGVLSLDELPQFKPITVAASWSEVHDDLIQLFPRQLVDRNFRLLRSGPLTEVKSLQDLLEAEDGSRFLVDDSQPAKWLIEQRCQPSRASEQYHAFPYPHRETNTSQSAGEHTLSGMGSPMEINHFVFGGRRNMSKPFRMLVAGGGTGDGTITAALGFAALGNRQAIIYHLDQSAVSVRTARSRLLSASTGLFAKMVPPEVTQSMVRFVVGSLLELPEMAKAGMFGEGQCTDAGLEVDGIPVTEGCENGIPEAVQFDFIQCVGVLMILPEPLQGLKALATMLKPTGGMAIQVYGSTGRTGVYDVQKMVRMLQQPVYSAGGGEGETKVESGQADIQAGLAVSKYLLDALPDRNWFRQNTLWYNAARRDDSERMDVMAHPCDRAYSVPELVRLVTRAGMRVTEWSTAAAYTLPEELTNHPVLGPRIQRLSKLRRYALGEMLRGDIGMHGVFLVPQDRPRSTVDGEGVRSYDSAGDMPLSMHSKLCRWPQTFAPLGKPEPLVLGGVGGRNALERCDFDQSGSIGRWSKAGSAADQQQEGSAADQQEKWWAKQQEGTAADQQQDEDAGHRYHELRFDLPLSGFAWFAAPGAASATVLQKISCAHAFVLQCLGGSYNLGCTRTVGDCYHAWAARAGEDAKESAARLATGTAAYRGGIEGAYEPSISYEACYEQAKANSCVMFRYDKDGGGCAMWTEEQVDANSLTADKFILGAQVLYDAVRSIDLFLHTTVG